MGQYYKTITQNTEGKITVYNRDTINKEGKKEYMMAKLMEHSWWFNPFVNAVALKLTKEPLQVAWIGDYAYNLSEDCDSLPHHIPTKLADTLYTIVWRKRKGRAVKETDFTIDNHYLINHTKKQFLDCNKYKELSAVPSNPEWIIHPLSLLTAIGNGLGGGDYRWNSRPNKEFVGCWAWDLLSLSKEKPDTQAYSELEVFFKEEY